MTDTGNMSGVSDGPGQHSVRDLLIERIARWLGDDPVWAESLINTVFCDPEIREAMMGVIETTILRCTEWETVSGQPLIVSVKKALAAKSATYQLFGPVKETE